MGYQVYETRHNRFGGYGVPAICEHSDCDEEIVRGVDSYCGGDPHSDEHGCCLSFCEKHVHRRYDKEDNELNEGIPMCIRCLCEKEPFPKKPETKEWVEHLLTDSSWGQWREENTDKVKELSTSLKEL